MVTLNDLEQRMAIFCVISPNSVALGAHYITAVEVGPTLYVTKIAYSQRIYFLSAYDFMVFCQRLLQKSALKTSINRSVESEVDSRNIALLQ